MMMMMMMTMVCECSDTSLVRRGPARQLVWTEAGSMVLSAEAEAEQMSRGGEAWRGVADNAAAHLRCDGEIETFDLRRRPHMLPTRRRSVNKLISSARPPRRQVPDDRNPPRRV